MELVTGNRFEDFAAACGAITAQTAIDRLLAGEAGSLVIGQGVSEQDANVIEVLGKAAGHHVARPPFDQRRAGRDVCHKHLPENQLISAPRYIEKDIFEADMLVDDRNEILSDHLTGCHLQGMLLIEATRQMFIAVGETQYGHLDVPANGYVVFDRLTTGFEQFAFPIPTWIRQTVMKAEKVKDDRVAFAATIEIFQAQGRVAQSDVSYTIFESSSLKPKEEKLANKAADALFDSLGRNRDNASTGRAAQMAGA